MEKEQNIKELTPDATLSQILSADKTAARLLASIGLEPTDHKDETLRSVCQQRQWSEMELLQWLKKNKESDREVPKEKEEVPEVDYSNDLIRWCSYIEDTFYQPNVELIQEVRSKFPRVKKVHANQYTWIKDMEYPLKKFLEDLHLYLEFGKKRFHPLVNKIEKNKSTLLDGTVRELERSLNIIHEDQQRLRQEMKSIRTKGHNFRNPEGACTTLRIMNHQLEELYAKLDNQFEVEEQLASAVKEKLQDL